MCRSRQVWLLGVAAAALAPASASRRASDVKQKRLSTTMQTGFGVMETVGLVSTVMTAIEAHEDISFKLKAQSDLLTKEHMSNAREKFETWVKTGNAERTQLFIKQDPYMQMEGLLEVMEDLQERCVPKKGFFEWILRWPRKLLDAYFSSEDDKQYRARLKIAQTEIKKKVEEVRTAFKMIVKAHCPDFQSYTFKRMQETLKSIRKWEDVTHASWFLMNKRAWWGHDLQAAFVSPVYKGVSSMPEQCRPRPTWWNGEELSTEPEVKNITLDQAYIIKGLFDDITVGLAETGSMLHTLHSECNWKFTEELRSANPEAAVVADCDPVINYEEFGRALIAKVAPIAGKVDAILSHPALGVADDIENVFHFATDFTSQAALPMANLLVWAVIKVSKSVDPYSVCLRAYEAISGKRPITAADFNDASKDPSAELDDEDNPNLDFRTD